MLRAPALRRALLLALLLGLAPVAAHAVSDTYMITSGAVTSVQVESPFAHTTPCEFGTTGNCLVNAPVGVTGGSIVLDPSAGLLDSLSMSVAGPGEIYLGGFFDIETITFTNATFATSAPAPLVAAGGGTFDFGPSQGSLTMDIVVVSSQGVVTVIPQYVVPGGPQGTLALTGGGATLELIGVDMGQFCSPLNPSRCANLKANFEFTASRVVPAIPEPQAFLVFGLGLLIVGWAQRAFGLGLSRATD